MIAPITKRHMFGWACEKILHPILEKVLQEPLVKTSNRFNNIDFRGAYWLPELKSRPSIDERGNKQDSKSYLSWLVPTCKETIAKNLGDTGELIFFYFWQGDNTLWYCKYDEALFSKIQRDIPVFSNQEHFWIPREYFTQVKIKIPAVEY